MYGYDIKVIQFFIPISLLNEKSVKLLNYSKTLQQNITAKHYSKTLQQFI
jgi:hypothetical protein